MIGISLAWTSKWREGDDGIDHKSFVARVGNYRLLVLNTSKDKWVYYVDLIDPVNQCWNLVESKDIDRLDEAKELAVREFMRLLHSEPEMKY